MDARRSSWNGCVVQNSALRAAGALRKVAVQSETPATVGPAGCMLVATVGRDGMKELLMWLVIAKQPAPDAPYWPGRRALTAADAVVWPLGALALLLSAPTPTGVVAPVAVAVAGVAAAIRLHRALWVNERYRFTTWRWGKVVAVLLLIGVVLKLTLPA